MTSKIIVWGTYDLGKPRVRILLRGIRRAGVVLTDLHGEVWEGIEDKSRLPSSAGRLKLLFKWLSKYPGLVARFLKTPKHAVVLVPYMGHLDVLILWPFARIRGTRIIWDAFISLYNTIVEDRQLVSKNNPVAWTIYAFEWLATRAADRVMLDTFAHAGYFAERYGISDEKLTAIFVGAEEEMFPLLPPLAPKEAAEPITVLFYGQFIPLHGIDTIVEAARFIDDGRVKWVLIGRGQEEDRIRALLDKDPVQNLTWNLWVPYDELIDSIADADICLGIFSGSEKASRVIPNKVFQVISAGRPLITRDSTAIRELIDEGVSGTFLVPPGDAKAIVDAVESFRNIREKLVGKALYGDIRPRITTEGIGTQFRERVLD